MAFEARRSAGARPKKPAPPYFSHEFIITNHGDIISCVLMVLLAGLFFQPTYSYSHTLIFPQYNETTQLPGDSSPQTYYRVGVRDIAAFFFYTLLWITVHCIIQEYVVDKIQRKLHMSRVRLARFCESSHLAPISAISFAAAVYNLYELGLHKDFSLLWQGYPDTHRYLTLYSKLFFIGQVSFWIHQFPEFYLQKLKKEEMKDRTVYSVLFLVFISLAYFTNFTRLATVLLALEFLSLTVLHSSRLLFFSGRISSPNKAFRLWNILYVLVRLSSMVTSVLVLWYGLRSHETPYVNLETGNFNTHIIRLNALLFLLLIQLYLVYNFARFHFGRWSSKPASHEPIRKKVTKGKKEEKKTK